MISFELKVFSSNTLATSTMIFQSRSLPLATFTYFWREYQKAAFDHNKSLDLKYVDLMFRGYFGMFRLFLRKSAFTNGMLVRIFGAAAGAGAVGFAGC